MEQAYNERRQEFSEAWNGQEGQELQKLFLSLGDWMAALSMDDAAVEEAMTALHRVLDLPGFDGFFEGERNWRALWSEASDDAFDTLPVGQKITSLHAYAFFGLSPNAERGSCTLDDIKSAIGVVKAAFGTAGGPRPETPEIDKTILAAEGRLALDEGRPVTLEQLAALARIGLRSMRNVATPSSGAGLEVKDGAATCESALKWLATRDVFKTSIWNRAADEQVAVDDAIKTPPAREGEILWVPVASDKSEFHPRTCLRADGYWIGPKGAEEKIADYREALDRLARMRPAAYWRRPNSANNWGIVTAETFRPKTASELGLESAKGGEK